MEKNNKSTSLGLGTILFLIFLTLKLAGLGVVATWSWWWVFSPILIPITALLIIFTVIGIATYIDSKL
jgi:fatty acid desaturase